MRAAVKICSFILDIVFPRYCLGCREEGSYCCISCSEEIERSCSFHTIAREKERPFEVFAVSIFHENALLAKLIHEFKYNGVAEIAALLVSFFPETIPKKIAIQSAREKTVLVPVPLHPRRAGHRGFNQSAILAQQLSAKWDIQTSDLLARHRFTRPQVTLSKEERATNIKDAFSLKMPHTELDPTILYLLVDDVCTTGSTLGECVRMLHENGARQVGGIVVGRAV